MHCSDLWRDQNAMFPPRARGESPSSAAVKAPLTQISLFIFNLKFYFSHFYILCLSIYAFVYLSSIHLIVLLLNHQSYFLTKFNFITQFCAIFKKVDFFIQATV